MIAIQAKKRIKKNSPRFEQGEQYKPLKIITMTFTAVQNKSTKTSQQVQEILFKNGYSHLFNYNDYLFFKKQCKNEFNPALSIAKMFIDYHDVPSDYAEYNQF